MAAKKGIYFNEDNHHFYGFHPVEEMTEERLRRLVDFYVDGTDVKGILFCTNVQRALFDSEVWERFRDLPPASGNLQPGLQRLAERGIDHFEVWLRRCREKGVEGWLTMRMNDCHGLCESVRGADKGIGIWASEKWKASPHLRRAPYRFERSWEGAYDYGLEEVRAHCLAFVRELFERYDMDGLELDWMRWGMCFAPGFEREGAPLLTEFVAEVRALADAAAERLGHPIALAHRLPASPEACLNCGFDVIEWGKRDLVDMVTLSSFLCGCNFDLPVKHWKALLPEGTVVNAYVEAVAESYPGNYVSSYELLLGGASAALSAGADNIYLFNECYRESDNPELLKLLLQNVASEERLAKLPRRLAVSFPQVSIAGDSARTVLPIPLRQPKLGAAFSRMAENVTVRLGAGRLASDSKCYLRLAFSKNLKPEDLAGLLVRVNTQPVEAVALPSYEAPVKGLKGQGLPQSAGFELVYAVPPSLLRASFNAVEFVPPQIDGTLEWCELLVLP